MKKWTACLMGAALVLFLCTVAKAQPQAGFEFHGLYGFNYSDDFAELENGWGGGASLVFCLGEFVKLDLGGDYIRPKGKDTDDDYVQMIPVTGTLRVGPKIGDIAYIYAGGGAGYSFNSLDTKSNIDDLFELEDSFTYHACGGFELMFTPEQTIGFRGEFRYVWLKPELKTKATGDKEDWKMDHMQVRGGFVVYF